MKILDKIIGKEAPKKLMDKSPCLAPWYFSRDNPKLIKGDETLHWKTIGSHGITALTDPIGNSYALISMSWYVLAADDSKSFLIWNRDLEKTIGLQTVQILYYESDKLRPIVGWDKTISQMESKKKIIHFAGEPAAKFEFSFNPKEEAMKFDFPDEFKKFGEFILLTELENLYDNSEPDNYWHNTTMLYINTDSGWVFNYPQDWFNKSNCDFMYQWITRAIKNPKTNLIHGQGIRIDDFVLDETNRQYFKKY
ncbi:hypothetical protein [Flavobacterium sp.]|uniref:hypothetical protein n=1 Tax=Flavobacterium sp. TaxID=239 RepID=UPI00262C0E17|nr:hypothetical protein [Flavobacterium sp.]